MSYKVVQRSLELSKLIINVWSEYIKIQIVSFCNFFTFLQLTDTMVLPHIKK